MQIQAPALRDVTQLAARAPRCVSQRTRNSWATKLSDAREQPLFLRLDSTARRPGNTLAPNMYSFTRKRTQKSGPGARALNNPQAKTALSFWMATRSVKDATHLSR